MKVIQDNINNITFFQGSIDRDLEYNQKYLRSILTDLEELNDLLDNQHQFTKKLYIDWEDVHTIYSEERVDPCPDFYGTFTLRFVENSNEHVGDHMNLSELDNALYILINFIEFKL